MWKLRPSRRSVFVEMNRDFPVPFDASDRIDRDLSGFFRSCLIVLEIGIQDRIMITPQQIGNRLPDVIGVGRATGDVMIDMNHFVAGVDFIENFRQVFAVRDDCFTRFA